MTSAHSPRQRYRRRTIDDADTEAKATAEAGSGPVLESSCLSTLPRDALLSILSQLHPTDVECLEMAMPRVTMYTQDPVLWRHFYRTLVPTPSRPYLCIRRDGRLDWRGAFQEAMRRQEAILAARHDINLHGMTTIGRPGQSSKDKDRAAQKANYVVEKKGNIRRIIAASNVPLITWDAHLAAARFDWANTTAGNNNIPLRRHSHPRPIQPSRTVPSSSHPTRNRTQSRFPSDLSSGNQPNSDDQR